MSKKIEFGSVRLVAEEIQAKFNSDINYELNFKLRREINNDRAAIEVRGRSIPNVTYMFTASNIKQLEESFWLLIKELDEYDHLSMRCPIQVTYNPDNNNYIFVTRIAGWNDRDFI